MEIKRWDTRKVIFKCSKCETLKEAVEKAIEKGISLEYANLENADLSFGNLIGADLKEAYLRNTNLKYAILKKANLSYSDLRDANLSYAILKKTDLSYSDLREANLSYANLNNANLNGANLIYAIGNLVEIRSMQLEEYKVVFTKDILIIGCEQHTIEEWRSFSDERIARMDDDALYWWKKWKDFIFKAIELSFKEE